MRDTVVIFDDGREIAVADLTNAEIGQTLDAIAAGRMVPCDDEAGSCDDLRERLQIELVARELPR